MTRPATRVVALLACVAVTSVAQQPPPAVQTLDEVTVSTPEVRQRGRVRVSIGDANEVMVRLEKSVAVHLRIVKEQTQVVFRRRSAARQLPEAGSDFFRLNQPLRLELLPDRLIARERPWIRNVRYLLAPNVHEADGEPAHIPFGRDIALVNLEHLSLRDSQRPTGITLANAMHPQTRRCDSTAGFVDLWPAGTNPLVLLGNTLRDCSRAARGREGDLLFAESVPVELRRVVRDLYDPIASRLANRLGSEPGTMFVAWWPESPHAGHRLQPSWNRNSLLLFHGALWQQGIDSAQREALRLSFMREQIQRRIRESDWPGLFTQSAVSYLLLLTRSGEDRATAELLGRELPAWISGCAGSMQRGGTGSDEETVTSLECGLLLQFVYDAVARFRSAGRQDIHDTWRRLLDAAYRGGKSGVKPADFLASSADAERIVQGLVDGSMDWSKLGAALGGIGVRLNAVSAGTLPAFEVRSLEHFRD